MSNPKYIGYYFTVTPMEPGVEILIAELGNVGFESFVETETGVNAFIQKEEWNEEILQELYILSSDEFEISFSTEEIEQVNWNEEWEKNFDPIIVEDECSVRAPFHQQPNTKYDIVIEPKMSFGTGHHQTTHMMIQHLLSADVKGQKVLDMGCGTGILAILAEMRGATDIEAVDIDTWCYENTIENIELNNCSHIKAFEGDVKLISGKKYDTIIANINRNILLSDIQYYVQSLSANGKLYLSGFYTEDLDKISDECQKHGLEIIDFLEKDNWVAASYKV